MGKSFVLTVMAATIFVSSAGASHAQLVSEPEIVAYAHGETPSFFAMTPAKVGLIGGLLGAAVMYATGAELIKKNGVPDPSADLARDLAQNLAERRMARRAAQPILTNVKKPATVAAAGDGARYVLTVQTTSWGHLYYALDWGHYSVFYNAQMQIIDVQTKAVVHAELCGWKSPKSGSPTRDDLLRDQAAGLKAMVATATDVCLHQFDRGLDRFTSPSRPMERPVLAESRSVMPPQAVTPPPSLEPIEPVRAVARIDLPPAPPPPMVSSPIEMSAVAATGATGQAPHRPVAIPVEADSLAPAWVDQWEPPRAAPIPAYVEYPYARPYEAPPSRTPPPPEVRYAGRDANGYLTWPGKRP